jgi:hypothetical protein
MRNVTKLGVLALLLVALVGSVVAYGNQAARDALEADDYDHWKEAKTVELTEERFEKAKEMHKNRQEKKAEIKAAIEQGYDAWAELMEDMPRMQNMFEVINEDNFETFVEMHEAKQAGDHETAKEIAKELGLQRPRNRGFGLGKVENCFSEGK